MADPDFYTRDRPRDARLPEDRPRGGTPGQHPGSSFRAFWLGVLILLVLCVVVIVAVG